MEYHYSSQVPFGDPSVLMLVNFNISGTLDAAIVNGEIRFKMFGTRHFNEYRKISLSFSYSDLTGLIVIPPETWLHFTGVSEIMTHIANRLLTCLQSEGVKIKSNVEKYVNTKFT